MIIHGSLRHDYSGRKKNTVGRKSVNKYTTTRTFEWGSGNYRRPQRDVKSLNSTACHTTIDPNLTEKQEAAKNYTVAIAYNKGAYQVIPKDTVKDIGK